MDCTDIIANRDTDGDDVADTEVNTGSFCPSRDQEHTNLTLKIDQEFADGTLTYIGAYQEYQYNHDFLGLDMGIASAFRAERNEEYDNFSQELRFTSADSDRFDYIVGAYYEDSEVSRFQHSSVNRVTILSDPTEGFLDRYEPWTTETTTLAAFGQVRWYFDNNINLILGGRYADEDKDFEFERYFAHYGTNDRWNIPRGPGGPPLVVNRGRSENKFTGAITVQWHTSDDVMLYAGLSQGHKTGGFSDRIESPDVSSEYDEEDVNSFEVGAKATMLGGALALNAALFYMDIEGLQLATQLPGDVPAFSVSNAADSTSQGIELDSTWAINSIWTLGTSIAYTKAEYDSFSGGGVPRGRARGSESE